MMHLIWQGNDLDPVDGSKLLQIIFLQVKCVVAHMNFKNMTEMGPCWGIICHADMTKSNLCFPQGQTC